MQPKKILCLDFDGVLHSYKTGWQGAAIISDEPVEGAMDFLCAAVQEFKVVIFSSRSHQEGGKQAMQVWLFDQLEERFHKADALEIFSQIDWPTEKPAALVTLDDRAIQFTGKWPSITDLLEFQPWYKT